jgi:hypothetical protein
MQKKPNTKMTKSGDESVLTTVEAMRQRRIHPPILTASLRAAKRLRAGEMTFSMKVPSNRRTASAAEIPVACLQDYNRATIIGELTFGRGIVCGKKSGGGNHGLASSFLRLHGGHVIGRRIL